jgi:hypothetical protein
LGCKTLLLLFPLHCLIIPVIPLHSHGHAADAWFQPFLDAVVVPVTPDRIAQEASSGIYKAKPQLHLMLISLAKRVIQRPAVDKTILKFSAGGIGGLDQDENSLVRLPAHICKRFYSVCSQIRVYGDEIRVKSR